MNNLNMKLVKVNGNTREDLLNALALLGEIDADFCGDNGVEYLWDKVWETNGFKDYEDFENKDFDEDDLKYESNMKYLLDTLKDIKSDDDLIKEYVSCWLDNDGYYSDYNLEVIYNSKEKAECIALATMSE